MNVGLFSTMTSLAAPFIRAGLAEPNYFKDLYVNAGAVIEWSGELLLADGVKAERPNPGNAQKIANDFAAMLYTGGWFSDVQVTYSGWFSVDFTVRVTVGVDFQRLADLRAIFEGIAWQTATSGWPHLAAQTENLYIVSVPRGVVVRQPNGSSVSGQTNRNNADKSNPNCKGSIFCECGEEWSMLKLRCVPISEDDSDENAVDALARWLGITPTQAAVVGVIGTVAALVAIKRVI